jgi:hypothetical protein
VDGVTSEGERHSHLQMRWTWLIAGAAALAIACGAAPPAGGKATRVETGHTISYRLFTHCGVRSAELNERTFFAQPPLDDGNGNPPPGWGNPYDDGSLTLVDQHTAVFRDLAGNTARFTDRPAGPTPTQLPCW